MDSNKTNLIKTLAKMRIRSDPMAANFGISEEDINYLNETMLMGLPEATIVTIVETYWKIKEDKNVDDKEIFEHIENIRSSTNGVRGNLPGTFTLFSYIKYRLDIDHYVVVSLSDDFIKKAIEKTNQYFGKVSFDDKSIDNLKKAFQGVYEFFKRKKERMTDEQRSILLTSEDKINSQPEKYLDQLNAIYKIMFNGFFCCAADGFAFVPENKIKEYYGKSLRENYPSYSSSTFMKFATSYWTLKILTSQLFPKYKKLMLYQLLKKLEIEISAYFFPTPGLLVIDPIERKAVQVELLLQSGAKIDIEEFISGNPFLQVPIKRKVSWFFKFLKFWNLQFI